MSRFILSEDELSGDGLNQYMEPVRLGFLAILVGSALLILLDVVAPPTQELAHLGAKVGPGLAAWVGLIRLPRTLDRRHLLVMTLSVIAILCAGVASAGVLGHDVITTPLFCLFVVIHTATALPWGAIPQLATVLITGAAIMANTAAVNGSLAVLGEYPWPLVPIALLGSLVISDGARRLHLNRRSMLEALRESEQTARGIIANLQDVYFRNDLDGNILMVSPSISRYGYTPEELIGKPSDSLYVDPTTRERGRQLLLEYGALTDFEVAFRCKDGSTRMVGTSARLLYDGAARPVAFEGVMRDVSDRLRASAEREASLSLLRATLDSTADGILVVDRQGRIVTFNEKFVELWRIPVEILAMRNDERAVASVLPQIQDADTFVAKIQQLYSEPDACSHDEIALVDGRRFERDSQPQYVAGQSVGRVWSFRDITERHRAQLEAAELQRQQQEETFIATTLARIGQELITSLDQPMLLDSLCRLTIETLPCDVSYVYLSQPAENVYALVAGDGDTAEHHEAARAMAASSATFGGLIEQLERDGFVDIVGESSVDLILVGLQPGLDRGVGMAVALRRGTEIIGVLTAGWHCREQPQPATRERLLRGIAQLGALALENARLVAELAQANRVKSDFVANMSHELRTPLGVILGYCDLLRDGEFGPLTDEQSETLQRVRRSGHELLGLVSATLDISRFDAKGIPLKRQQFRVEDLMDELARDAVGLPRNVGVTLEWSMDQPAGQLSTDRLKLKMILKNIIGNAMKFTTQGNVWVSVHRYEDGFEFRVRDTGIGVAPAARDAIFEPFYQGDASGAGQGAGLGLYIVKRLCQALGAAIAVDSEIGRGTEFRIRVPSTT